MSDTTEQTRNAQNDRANEWKRWQRPAAVALILLGIVVAVFPDLFARVTGYRALNDYAVERTASALERDRDAFLVVSGVKASLALLEGSSVGVGVEVQVGDIVQPAYDYIDFFWRVFLYAFLVLGFYQLLLETGLLLLGLNLLGLGAAVLGVGWLHPNAPSWLARVGKRCVLIGVLIAYVAPFSIVISESLNERYIHTLKAHHLEAMEAYRNELDGASAQFFALRQRISVLRPGDSLDEIRTGLLRIAEGVYEAFQLSLTAFLFYVLTVLFELVVFPLLSALILYKFTQWALGRLFNTAPASTPAPAPAAS